MIARRASPPGPLTCAMVTTEAGKETSPQVLTHLRALTHRPPSLSREEPEAAVVLGTTVATSTRTARERRGTRDPKIMINTRGRGRRPAGPEAGGRAERPAGPAGAGS